MLMNLIMMMLSAVWEYSVIFLYEFLQGLV